MDKQHSRQAEGSVVDPICGMTVNPETAAGSFNHEGTTYYFCSKGCLQKFINQTSNGKNQPQANFVQIGRKKETVSHAEIFRHGQMIAAPAGTEIDPVCKMRVSPETAAGNYEYKGEIFYFCSTDCLNKFRQNPVAFLEGKKEEKLKSEDEDIEYTCPMHPEIVQIGAGTCPKCGMALEPKTFSLEQTEDPELKDMTKRFWISAILTIPVFALAMAEMLPNFNDFWRSFKSDDCERGDDI